MKPIVIFSVLGFWVLLIALFGEQEVSRIDLVVPDDFTGTIRITESANGQEVKEKDGVFRLEVPESGVLLIKSIRPFHRWHEQNVQFSSGASISSSSTEDKRQGEVYYRSTGTDSDGTISYEVFQFK